MTLGPDHIARLSPLVPGRYRILAWTGSFSQCKELLVEGNADRSVEFEIGKDEQRRLNVTAVSADQLR